MYLHKSPLNEACSLSFKCTWITWSALVRDIIYCVFIPGCNHRWSVADLRKYNFLSVLKYSSRKMNAVLDVFDLQWKDETVIGTHTPVSHWSRLIPRLCSLPLPQPPFTDILSLSTHASLAHTPLPLLLRGGTAVSDQARPLRSADRALIWRPMPRKRLIKAGADEKEAGPYHGEWKHLSSPG